MTSEIARRFLFGIELLGAAVACLWYAFLTLIGLVLAVALSSDMPNEDVMPIALIVLALTAMSAIGLIGLYKLSLPSLAYLRGGSAALLAVGPYYRSALKWLALPIVTLLAPAICLLIVSPVTSTSVSHLVAAPVLLFLPPIAHLGWELRRA